MRQWGILEGISKALPRAFLVLGIGLLVGCQTLGLQSTDVGSGSTAQSGNRISKSFYSPFFNQVSHLEELVDAGNFEDAHSLIDEQQLFFADPRNVAKAKVSLERLHESHMAYVRTTLGRIKEELGSIEAPLAVKKWHETSKLLDEAQEASTNIEYDGLYVLSPYRNRLNEQYVPLQAALKRTREVLKDFAPVAFSYYDLLNNGSFFESYPIDTNARELMQQRWPKVIELLGYQYNERLSSFLERYRPSGALTDKQLGEIAALYYNNALTEALSNGQTDITARISAGMDTVEAGLDLPTGDALAIGFADATSKTLLEKGLIDFPPEIELDLPVEVETLSLDEVKNIADLPDMVVVFQVLQAKASRRVKKLEAKGSRAVVKIAEQVNPDYQKALMDYNEATRRSNSSGGGFDLGSSAEPAAIIAGLVIGLAAEAYSASKAAEAKAKAAEVLENTPRIIRTPVYQHYAYTVADIRAEKTLTVKYYIIDRDQQIYYSSLFDIVEEEKFASVEGVEGTDPDSEEIWARYDTEQTITAWEDEPATVPLSAILADYRENGAQAKKLNSLAALQSEIVEDRFETIAAYQAKVLETTPESDPRFKHVVRVNVRSSQGTGFYVTPDVVMTNWHVVKNSEYTELVRFDGTETFGRVIARDVRLDLALIKVQAQGDPVVWFEGKSFPLGSTVEAIGSPLGLDFTVTRGIVSAVRERKSPNAGGDKVLIVQTDAAINGGNSGGPLFLDGRVIGVNTWGIGEFDSGLNFSVHFSEARAFMNEILNNGAKS